MVFIIYSNTFQAAWHLDDYHNILNNPWLKIEDLHPKTIIQTFYASFDRGQYSQSKIYRPVPCLTFALNWYFGQDNPFGYHLVNLVIHLMTAFILFLTISALFKTPALRNKYEGSEYFIALLAAVLWAINPIQTQAVTYIVQRMASMAAMFYIAGIYLYVRARSSTSHSTRIKFYLGCGVAFLLAVGSKENAVLMPLALVLVEFIFFQDMGRPRTRKIFFRDYSRGRDPYGRCRDAAVYQQQSLGILNYHNRPFTALERLLTEPRIIIFYLSQIFYPVASRLSIEHEFPVSTSIIDPWTTVCSIFVILLLIGIGLWQMRKRPVLSFAILFFFLNHAVESTVIGLELVFEHRNYLPSMFVFFPVAMGFKWLLDHYRGRQSLLPQALSCFMALLLFGFGFGTYVRNQAWDTEGSLWQDAVAKAPNSGRALHNLAWGYLERIGRPDLALQLYRKSLKLGTHNKVQQSMTLNNMANLYYQSKDYQKASDLWSQASGNSPKIEFFKYRLAMASTKSGDLANASYHLEQLLQKHPEDAEYNFLKGSILLKQKQYKRPSIFYSWY